MKALQRRVGVAFLFVTHDQEEALSLSDRIAVMNCGRIEQIGSPQEVYLAPRSRFVAGFLGAMNWHGSVGVRPESTRISREAPDHGMRFLPATVHNAVFLGNCFHIESRLAGGETLIAEVPRAGETFSPGDSVHVWWNPADELVFPQEAPQERRP